MFRITLPDPKALYFTSLQFDYSQRIVGSVLISRTYSPDFYCSLSCHSNVDFNRAKRQTVHLHCNHNIINRKQTVRIK